MNSAYAITIPNVLPSYNFYRVLKKVLENVLKKPCFQTANVAYSFIVLNKERIMKEFCSCKYKDACKSDNICINNVQKTLHLLLMPRKPPLSGNYVQENHFLEWRWWAALREIQHFYNVVKDICCTENVKKWVIRGTERGPVCMSTNHVLIGEKSYNDPLTCEFALYRNTPEKSSWVNTTKCNEYGCWQEIVLKNKKSYQ